MSHAANLRSSQRAQEVSSKKRKLSETSTRLTVHGINGIFDHNSSTKLSVAPSRDVKALKQKQSEAAGAKVGHADGDVNVTGFQQEAESSSEESSEEDDSDDDEDDDEDTDAEQDPHRRYHSSTKTNGAKADDSDSESGSTSDSSSGSESHVAHKRGAETMRVSQDRGAHSEPLEDGEMSFGDRLRSREGATVDVSAQDDERGRSSSGHAPPRSGRHGLSLPSANSLGTVLSQALRTNDTALLESCLQVGNLQNIRATIERLPSQQAGQLLQKLAERMHKRPGRAGSLMVWIQWTVVAHGGFLATQPEVMSHLRELHRVVKMRASALQPLLALKGKLDMLEAQLQLRKNRAAQAPPAQPKQQEGYIYIEGETPEDHSDDEAADAGAKGQGSASKAALRRDLMFGTDEEADDEPMVNGVTESGDGGVGQDEDEDSDDSDDEDLIDDEASVDSDEAVSVDEIEYDDVDDEESASEQEQPAPKRSKKDRR